MATNYKNPEYIVIDAIDEDDARYPEVNITEKARIPVIALSYEDKDIAKKKELLVDYKKGGIYVVDAEDRTIIHDLSKLIAENYLNKIDGNNTYVTIEGIGLVNLADILKILYDSRIQLINIVDDVISLPKEVSFDNRSIGIAGYSVEVFGFHNAKPLSIPRVSEDGSRIEWVNGVEDERPGGDIGIANEPPGGFEPPLGAVQNVLYIYPTEDNIILYNKPQQFTAINEALLEKYLIKTPLTQMQYAKFEWRLDTEVDLNLVWEDNLIWITPKPEGALIAGSTHIFSMNTWDYGNTWIVRYIGYMRGDGTILAGDLPPAIFYTDENSNLLKSGDGSLLIEEV